MIDVVKIDPDAGTGEVGYFLSLEYRGQGIVSAALAVVIDRIHKQAGLKQLKATADPRNAASINILNNAGFANTGGAEMSEYLGDPEDCEDWKDGKLQLTKRLPFAVDVKEFLSRWQRSKKLQPTTEIDT
jgi:RimJ/RimL family protein N-acetyltransferase